jgi:predicted GH43/DUF377 family glycosyl hydrolase
MKSCKPFGRRLFLQSRDIKWEERAVLNPSTVLVGDDVHFYYRAVDRNMVSSIGYLRIQYKGDRPEIVEQWDEPLLAPALEWDAYGVEDPRVLEFEGRWYMFYTAYDGKNAQLAYAVGDSPTSFTERHLIGPKVTYREGIDLVEGKPALEPQFSYWQRHGTDGYLWEKDATILPERHNGKLVFIHRLQPNAQIALIDSLEQVQERDWWVDHIRNLENHLFLTQKYWWEESHMGMGPVPLKTDAGWLFIYHGCTYEPNKVYRAGAALLDLNDPTKVIGRYPEPLFEPVEDWEQTGDVDNVVFPEGLVRRGDILDIYYGGADSVIGLISVNLKDLLECMKEGA